MEYQKQDQGQEKGVGKVCGIKMWTAIPKSEKVGETGLQGQISKRKFS